MSITVTIHLNDGERRLYDISSA